MLGATTIDDNSILPLGRPTINVVVIVCGGRRIHVVVGFGQAPGETTGHKFRGTDLRLSLIHI